MTETDLRRVTRDIAHADPQSAAAVAFAAIARLGDIGSEAGAFLQLLVPRDADAPLSREWRTGFMLVCIADAGENAA